ncbi:MAG: 50S ribosomal protein L29 [Cyclobacteriaceae bacterium]|jgi:large subunit ribosomal protein L29
MKNSEITGLSIEEIRQKLASEQETLRKLRFAHQVSAIESPMKIQETRRLIARLNTVLTQKERQK